MTSALQPSQTYGLVYSQPVSGSVMRSVANQAGHTVASHPLAPGIQSYALSVRDERPATAGIITDGERILTTVKLVRNSLHCMKAHDGS